MAEKFKWYGKEVNDAVAKGLIEAIKIGCHLVEGDAKINCPFITSRLKSSITPNWTGSGKGRIKSGHEGERMEGDGMAEPKEELTGVVGSNVEYARRVEFGFVGADSLGRIYNQLPNPYLRKALETNKKEILRSFKNIIK